MASIEAIRRGYRHMRDVYSAESMVMAGLYSRLELDAFRKELDDAYEILSDSFKRRSYDETHMPADFTRTNMQQEPVLTPCIDEALPPMPEIDGGTSISGELLKQVRMSRGLKLRDVADQTKIGLSYLSAIEEETFSKLPAPVYIRGFISQYAKILGLDPSQVSETYLARMQRNQRNLSVE